MHQNNLTAGGNPGFQPLAAPATRSAEGQLAEMARQMADMARTIGELKSQNGVFVKLLGVLTKAPTITPSAQIPLRDAAVMMPPHRRSPVTLRRYAKSGRIPAEKIGHQWVVDAAVLQQQLDEEKRARAAVGRLLGKPARSPAAPVPADAQASVGAFLAKRPYARRQPAQGQKPRVGDGRSSAK